MFPTSLRLVTAPAQEPVALDDLKAQLRVDGSDEDFLLSALLTTARQAAENFLRRPLITQTWELTLDAFPGGVLELPLPPVQAVTSLTYTDSSGVTQALITTPEAPAQPTVLCQVDTDSEPARLLPLYGQAWPATQAVPNAVRVRFTCGYGDNGDSVPMAIRQAILILAARLNEHREGVSDGKLEGVLGATEEALLWPYRFLRF